MNPRKPVSPPTARGLSFKGVWVSREEDGTVIVAPDLPWTARLTLETVAGAPRIVGLTLMRRPEATPDQAVITATDLRRLPLGLFERAAAAILSDGVEDVRTEISRHRAAGEAWGDEHYQEVAEVYRQAVAARRPPLAAIGTRWGVGRAMAAKYVKRARELGHLGYPTRPGVAGATAKKSPIRKKESK